MTFLSNCQRGLLDGVATIFPDSYYGYCLRHLEQNFRKEFKHSELKALLWKAARATTEAEFNEALLNMSKIDDTAVHWLLDHAKPEYWAEFYFKGNRYGHLTSNIAESLNAWILEAREKPIVSMLEKIREQLMEWFDTRRKIDINVNGLLVEKVARIIQTLINTRACKYRYIASMETSYEVKSKETLTEYLVNLELHTCSCKLWQSNEYPCGHALAIIIGRREDPQLYVKQFYMLEAYRGTYSAPIFHPMQSQNDPPEFAAATLQELGVLDSSSILIYFM